MFEQLLHAAAGIAGILALAWIVSEGVKVPVLRFSAAVAEKSCRDTGLHVDVTHVVMSCYSPPTYEYGPARRTDQRPR